MVLLQSAVPVSAWIAPLVQMMSGKRWLSIVKLSGRHYHLPGGSTGRKYNDQLTQDLCHFSAGDYPSERFIVFSSLILQRDQTVRKGADIRRVIERRLSMWNVADYNLLIQDAERCDKPLHNHNKYDYDELHTTKVFTRLMLLGKVKAAVRWVSDKTRGKVLQPDESVLFKHQDGSVSNAPVLDLLQKKHPESQVPPISALLSCDNLPAFEDVEVTGNVIQKVASLIQGSAGPDGCDSGHWQVLIVKDYVMPQWQGLNRTME